MGGAHIPGGAGGQLSSTNLYIGGLSPRCCDDDLVAMCQQYVPPPLSTNEYDYLNYTLILFFQHLTLNDVKNVQK